MRGRLEGLGVTGVRASTFHSAALSQLRYFRPEAVGKILSSKALIVYNIVRALPAPFKFRAAGDYATEIEWARNRRIPPSRYRDSIDGHQPPVPDDVMQRVYERYELVKREQGLIDFEDLLERAIELFEDEQVCAEFRERYHAFTVDEYQDVNLLQQTLLDAWLGERDDLCVVGDDYQSIYGFTGATPAYLLGVATRFPHAEVIRLEDNYRSTPEVLDLANRLVPKLGGAEKTLRPVAARRAGAGGAAVRDRGGRGRLPRRADPRGDVPARGDRDPRAHARAVGRRRGSCSPRPASRIRAPRCSLARRPGASCARSSPTSRPRRSARSRPISAGCRTRPRSSARGSRRARATSRASSGSQTRSAARARTSAPSSSAVTATAATGGRESTCSRTTARRASSSRSSCSLASRRRSCRPSSPAHRRRSTRSGACSTSG